MKQFASRVRSSNPASLGRNEAAHGKAFGFFKVALAVEGGLTVTKHRHPRGTSLLARSQWRWDFCPRLSHSARFSQRPGPVVEFAVSLS